MLRGYVGVYRHSCSTASINGLPNRIPQPMRFAVLYYLDFLKNFQITVSGVTQNQPLRVT